MSMADDDNENQDDLSIWKLYTQDIEAWRDIDDSAKPVKVTSTVRPKTKHTKDHAAPQSVNSKGFKRELEPAAAQIDKRTDMRLKRGQIAIEAKLDLHGLYLKDAHSALSGFILDAYNRGLRCVLVVTGKGKLVFEGERAIDGTPGVIKRNFKNWLAEPLLSSIVLKAQTAQIKHGGEGAYYVYLRKKR